MLGKVLSKTTISLFGNNWCKTLRNIGDKAESFRNLLIKVVVQCEFFSWKSLESFSLSRIEHIMREQNFSLKFNDSYLRKFCEQSTALAHSTLSLSFNKTTAEAIPGAFPRSYAFANRETHFVDLRVVHSIHRKAQRTRNSWVEKSEVN